MVDDDRRRQAAEAERLLDRDGDAAAEVARGLIGAETADDVVTSISHRILAISALRNGDAAEASGHIDESIAAAEHSCDPVLLGKALMTAMAVAASTGDLQGALEFADRAEPLLPADLRIRLAIQRGSVLVAGFSDVDGAITVFDQVLVDHPDLGGFELGILRLNRGTQLLRRGDLPEASDDFALAADEFRTTDNRQFETTAMLHGAVTAARMSDLPTVFAIHRELTETDALSQSDPHDFFDLAQCLVIAGLLIEASALIQHAIELAHGSTGSEFSVQVELLAARIQRLLGDAGARGTLDRAQASARELGNDELLAIAMVEGAALGVDDATADSEVADLRRAVETLTLAGHRREALEAEIEALRREVDLPYERRRTNIFDELPSVDTGRTPFDRAQLRHLRALRFCLRDDSAQARRELVLGIRDIETARVAIAADDLRSAAGDRAPQMAALGLRLAIEAGRPRPVLEWAERVRATALRLANPVRTHEHDIQDQLDELRRLEVSEPTKAAELERTITSRLRAGRDSGTVIRAANAAEICRSLGPDRTLLEYLVVDGRLWLCIVERQRASLIDLEVAIADVKEWVDKLVFGMGRMSTRTGPPAEAATKMVEGLATRLAGVLLPDRAMAASEVVVVPTGPLHHLPWAALPPLITQSFVVAPTAHVWCTVANQPDRGSGVMVAIGPGLDEAADEVQEVSAIWGQPSLPGTTSADLRALLPGSRIAHLCCHGRFRTDSPQFSALVLDDGPFTVFDLEGISDLPGLFVLSACSLGSVDVRTGDDLLGFPAALFARGVSTLIAAVLPVEDVATRAVMVRLHEGLAAGASPAVALRDARVALIGIGAPHAAATASFLCFGAG